MALGGSNRGTAYCFDRLLLLWQMMDVALGGRLPKLKDTGYGFHPHPTLQWGRGVKLVLHDFTVNSKGPVKSKMRLKQKNMQIKLL